MLSFDKFSGCCCALSVAAALAAILDNNSIVDCRCPIEKEERDAAACEVFGKVMKFNIKTNSIKFDINKNT